jgi:hypothetical protein
MKPPIGKKIIYGCAERGDAGSPYLTRYTLVSFAWLQVCLHIFHRSDGPELHDHPWPFASLILWRGYIEEKRCSFEGIRGRGGNISASWFTRRTRVWPGMILFRPATHAHRVELVNDKRAVTLVFMGPKQRTWGFFTKAGWQRWTEYFRERGC